MSGWENKEYVTRTEHVRVIVEVELMYNRESNECRQDALSAARRMLKNNSTSGAGINGVYRADVKDVRME